MVASPGLPFGLAGGFGPPDMDRLHVKWGWVVALGTVYLLAGIVALGSVVLATVASMFVVGIMMLVAGVAEVIGAFQMKGWGRSLAWVLLGALYILAGIVTFENPLLAAVVLTFVLGVVLIVSGVMRIVLAISMGMGSMGIGGSGHGNGPAGWVAASGVVTLLIGLIILMHWPVSGLYILGLFLGIDLVFAGGGWIGLGLALRRLGRRHGQMPESGAPA